MNVSDMRESSDTDLQNLVSDTERELWQARFDNHTNQLDDTSKVKKLRRRIAQAKTLLTERTNAGKTEE